MGSVSEVQTTVAEKAVTSKKVRVKVLVKKPVNGACKVSEVPEVNCVEKVPSADVGIKPDAGEKKLKSTLGTKRMFRACQSSKQVPRVNCLEKSSVTHNRVTTAFSGKKLNPIAGCKRRSEEVLENHERKRQKMDGSATLTCYNILTNLMNHKQSAPFRAPVKPALWGIHDYFDIIKKPMDLGTIKKKLTQDKYLGAEQFEADMRLTFSNAMLYNPPGNWCHESAKELLRVFDRLWKPFKIKIDRQHRDAKQKGYESSDNDTAFDVKDKGLESISAHRDQFAGKALPRNEKSSEDLKKLSVEGQHSDRNALTESSHNKTAFDVKDKNLESVSARGDQFPGKALPRKVKSSEDLKKLSVEGQHRDLKVVKESSHNKAAFDVKYKDRESVSAHRDQFPGKALPRKVKSSEDLKKLSVEGQRGDLKAVKESRGHYKTAFDVKYKDRESASARRDQFPEKALPRKVKSSEDLKKLSVERQYSDLKAVKASSDTKAAFDVKYKDLERVSARGDQIPGKVLPRKAKSSEDLKKLSVEGQHRDLKAVKSGEPKQKLMRRDFLSPTKSDISGPASQSARPMPAKGKCESTPGRKIAHDNVNAVKVKSTATLQRGSNGQGSDREDHGFDSFPTTTGFLDFELSPSRALRVAKLKERYSETILKTQNHTLLEQGGGTDAAWRKGKVMLQRRQNEEKARIEAQVKAVKSAARLETESKLEKQRQAEREAMKTMKQSVFVDDNLQVLKDLEAIIGCPLEALVVTCHDNRSCAGTLWSQMKSDKLGSPLERLGLHIKEEYQLGNENDYVVSMDEDCEEGELIC